MLNTLNYAAISPPVALPPTYTARVPAGLSGAQHVFDDATWRRRSVLQAAVGVAPDRYVNLLQHCGLRTAFS